MMEVSPAVAQEDVLRWEGWVMTAEEGMLVKPLLYIKEIS